VFDKHKPLDILKVESGVRQTQTPGYTRGNLVLDKHGLQDIPEVGSGVRRTQTPECFVGGIRS
jgi:hypothetical protein